jgi:hypothetical protein
MNWVQGVGLKVEGEEEESTRRFERNFANSLLP